MEQLVRVRKLYPNATAQVVLIRQSACSGDCHKCAGCGAAEETMVFTAKNPIDAQPGDLVRVESATAPVLAAAAVFYLLPLVLFLAGYIAGLAVWGVGIWMGLGAFTLGIIAAVLYDRLVVAKRKTEYTITGFVSR